MFSKPIFFLHNPKAGGTSISNLLRSLNVTADIAPDFSNAPNNHRVNLNSVPKFSGYRLYIGHYGYENYKRFGRGHDLITNFRHPVSRIHSLYRYWRHNVRLENLIAIDPTDARVVALAHQLNFSDFIRHPNPDLRLYLDNAHFRQLYRCNWTPETATADKLAIVKRRIDAMPWIFISEAAEISSHLFQIFLPELAVTEIPHHNTSAVAPDTVSFEDEAYIEQINDADLKIYSHALQLQQSRAISHAGRVCQTSTKSGAEPKSGL